MHHLSPPLEMNELQISKLHFLNVHIQKSRIADRPFTTFKLYICVFRKFRTAFSRICNRLEWLNSIYQ